MCRVSNIDGMFKKIFGNSSMQKGISADDLEELYRLYSQKMYRLAYRYLSDTYLASETVQRIFVSLWERREELEIQGPAENYLIRAVKLSVFKQLQKEVYETSLDQTVEIPEQGSALDDLIYQEVFQKVNKLIDELSPKGKEIFIMSREKGMKNKEIATTLNVSEKTVEYHISSSLKFLREGLQA